MKKRKAKRIKKVNDVDSQNLNKQIETSEFSENELKFLHLIAKIIVRISIEESYQKDQDLGKDDE